jgi:FixJ family two-component response regulator
MTRPTVYLVDDDRAVLDGIARVVRSGGATVAAFESGQAFLDALPKDAEGCVVVDLSMPGMDGMALQQTLIERESLLAVIFLTGRGDLASCVDAMRAGAVDFLAKPVSADTLLSAVGRAVERSRVAGLAAQERDEIRRRIASLTPREREVMALVVSGKLNKQIAAELGTVEQTVKMHRARVMAKMQANSLAALVRLADRAAFAPPTTKVQ